MTFSTRERISHVARRLGFGVERSIVEEAATVDDAVAAALDLSPLAPPPPDLEPPLTMEAARTREQNEAPYAFWLGRLVGGPRRIEERLTWFFSDHFATNVRKVGVPYLMYRQHLTIRTHAATSFSDLLHAIAIDPAMLLYLDGVHNAADKINENFGREVLELYTLGIGNYTETDVIEASRAFTGWIVLNPQGRAMRFFDGEPWSAVFASFRHDAGVKTLVGTTATLNTADAIDVLLDHPATAKHLASKLWLELVGTPPDPGTVSRLGGIFRRDYRTMELVEAIVADPAFTADAAIRTKIRTPLEQAIGVIQLAGPGEDTGRGLFSYLRAAGYMPFQPPNPAGYPKGNRLLGPGALVHSFDLAGALPPTLPDLSSREVMARLGIYDLTEDTRATLNAASTPRIRAALAINSPEYHLT